MATSGTPLNDQITQAMSTLRINANSLLGPLRAALYDADGPLLLSELLARVPIDKRRRQLDGD